jgi:hypothetical protein
MTDLPTRATMFTNCAEALDEAGVALSNARDWLRSDWTPVGSSLTDTAADARVSVLRAITDAKTLLDEMRRDINAAVDSLTAETTT